MLTDANCAELAASSRECERRQRRFSPRTGRPSRAEPGRAGPEPDGGSVLSLSDRCPRCSRCGGAAVRGRMDPGNGPGLRRSVAAGARSSEAADHHNFTASFWAELLRHRPLRRRWFPSLLFFCSVVIRCVRSLGRITIIHRERISYNMARRGGFWVV
ncbi:hypothetical protein F2P81_016395 [Scophthalmus maximus]|uniref:Uncharacterized protein n=1 Tax=Scophthalmus maximus TaxID=52904 RepID=A0A6A4SIY0_SCOMX|nr:hypothetical protein F2P81_016395 [Scophthalmus maximus]